MKDVFSRHEMNVVKKSMSDSHSIIKEASDLHAKNVFLSYSSDDSDIVMYVYEILKSHGGRVYLDKFDLKLQKTDFTKVAKQLTKAVKQCDKLVLLVSKNVKDSIWIPWEIGLGHGYHTKKNVALFLASDNLADTSWKNQEYLGMYQRIASQGLILNREFCIYDPDTNETVNDLREWLNDNKRVLRPGDGLL